MVNRTIVSIFNEYKGFWNKYTNEYDFMYVKIPNDTKNAVRQNFGISFNEEILFVRDTSFWSSKNQGLVITDNGIYCIPDNNSPEEKIEFGWKDVSKVKFRDWVLFFYGYGNEEDYCPIHVSYFCKKEELYDKIGNKCAEMFLRIANSTQPEKDVTSQVWELIRQQKQDEALELAMRYRNIEGNEELYLCLVSIYLNKQDFGKVIEYCTEGLQVFFNLSEEKLDEIGGWIPLLTYYRYSAHHIQRTDLDNLKSCRNDALTTFKLVSETATRGEDGKLVKEDARDDFNAYNEIYATDYLSLPYNERKLLYPVKEYNTPLEQEHLAVLDLKNLEKTGIAFPIGHPVANQLYVGHPYIPNKYIPFDNYELALIEDKVREFCQIVQALGATEISIECLNSLSNTGNSTSIKQGSIGVDYNNSQITATGNIKKNKNNSFINDISQSLTLHQRFSPNRTAALPENLVWYHNEPSWQRLYEQRMRGGLDEHEERMETKKNQVVENSELVNVALEVKRMVLSVNGTWEQTMEEKFEGHENAVLAIHVKFAPLSSLECLMEEANNKENSMELSSIEQEYVDELKACIDGGNEISPRERRLLNRLCAQLGISEVRAAELENLVIQPQLTDDEKEYLSECKECFATGEISEKERRLLNKLRMLLNISAQRADELEKMAICH